MAAVSFEAIKKVYPDGTLAIPGLDLDVVDGEFMVLVGPSGCGKTTALRMVAGLEEISGGVLRIGDRVVNHVPSRDRDIAMVFQSYALYPHLSVFENIAFGLRVKKVPKDEIERRVQDAARVLDLEPFLKRKPRALSGGQRQRVAMGRAIVRQPQAFLMDEPLSNLDAKLRVQMRAEIARLQHDLGVTTIYVTHDQVEAMTMGDRVAVMRKGELQQVADPQELYDRPVNLFVGGFIGSPAMNMVEATAQPRERAPRRHDRLARDHARRRDDRDPSGARVVHRLRRHPRGSARGPRGRVARARHAGRPPSHGNRATSRVARLRGDGAPRGRRAARRHGGCPRARRGHGRRRDPEPRRRRRQRRPSSAASTRGRGCARARSRRSRSTPARSTSSIPGRVSGSTSTTRPKEAHDTVPPRSDRALCIAALAATAAATASQASHASSRSARPSRGASRSSAIWTGPEQKRFQAVLDGFQKLYPNVKAKYTSGGDNTPTILATAIQGGNPPDLASIGQPGLLRDFANQGASSRSSSLGRPPRGTTRPTGSSSAPSRASSTASFFKGANKSTVWYSTAAFKAAGVKPPKTWPQLLGAANTIRASGTPGLLDRRRRRLDAHRPVREHLPPPGRARALRPAAPRTRSRGRIRR